MFHFPRPLGRVVGFDPRKPEGSPDRREDLVVARLFTGGDIENSSLALRKCRHIGSDDVGDLDVISGFGPIAVNRRSDTAEHLLREDGDHPGLPLRTLPRPVDIPVSEHHERRPVELSYRRKVNLEGILAGAIGREGARRRLFVGGKLLRLAVYRATRRGINEPADLEVAREQEHIQRSQNVR